MYFLTSTNKSQSSKTTLKSQLIREGDQSLRIKGRGAKNPSQRSRLQGKLWTSFLCLWKSSKQPITLRETKQGKRRLPEGEPPVLKTSMLLSKQITIWLSSRILTWRMWLKINTKRKKVWSRTTEMSKKTFKYRLQTWLKMRTKAKQFK